jgi:hypothetical protein
LFFEKTMGEAMRSEHYEDVSAGGNVRIDNPAEQHAPSQGPSVAPWPDPVAPEALHGLAGEFVKLVAPHTEADDAALLGTFLTMFGNAAGRSSFYPVGADRHTPNINIVLVGDTASGRKGVSLSQTRSIFELIDSAWANARIQSGLSSGEGLIWAVRDEIERLEPLKEKGRVVGYQTVIADAGIADKRLLVLETEFSSVLKVAEREGSTLTGVIRQAWDTGHLRVLTKTSPAKSTGGHISIIGHIPKDELLRYITTTELGNGVANRVIWECVRRSKELPDGGNLTPEDLIPIVNGTGGALKFAQAGAAMRRDDEARELWHSVYGELSARRPGLLGAVLSRSEAQVVRLSVIYALLDQSLVIRAEHLTAALAFWQFAEDSVRCIFGERIGDPVADTILQNLRSSPSGLTRTEIRDLFSRHGDKDRIDSALGLLERQYLVKPVERQTGGRPSQIWTVVRTPSSTDARNCDKSDKRVATAGL